MDSPPSSHDATQRNDSNNDVESAAETSVDHDVLEAVDLLNEVHRQRHGKIHGRTELRVDDRGAGFDHDDADAIDDDAAVKDAAIMEKEVTKSRTTSTSAVDAAARSKHAVGARARQGTRSANEKIISRPLMLTSASGTSLPMKQGKASCKPGSTAGTARSLRPTMRMEIKLANDINPERSADLLMPQVLASNQANQSNALRNTSRASRAGGSDCNNELIDLSDHTGDHIGDQTTDGVNGDAGDHPNSPFAQQQQLQPQPQPQQLPSGDSNGTSPHQANAHVSTHHASPREPLFEATLVVDDPDDIERQAEERLEELELRALRLETERARLLGQDRAHLHARDSSNVPTLNTSASFSADPSSTGMLFASSEYAARTSHESPGQSQSQSQPQSQSQSQPQHGLGNDAGTADFKGNSSDFIASNQKTIIAKAEVMSPENKVCGFTRNSLVLILGLTLLLIAGAVVGIVLGTQDSSSNSKSSSSNTSNEDGREEPTMTISSPSPSDMPAMNPASSATPTQKLTPAPTSLPTVDTETLLEERYQQLLDIMIADESPNAIEIISDSSSANSRAIRWMARDDPAQLDFSTFPRRRLKERYVMALFYLHHRGNQWFTRVGWMSELDICLWEGLSCIGASQTISQIEAGSNSLRNNLLTEIGTLADLRTLDASDNLLGGTLPSELGMLSELRKVELYDCGLTGTIPTEIGSLIDLNYLDLEFNLISGAFPTEHMSEISISELYTVEMGNVTGNLNPWLCTGLDNSIPRNGGLFATTTCLGANPSIRCDCCAICCDENECCGETPTGNECVPLVEYENLVC